MPVLRQTGALLPVAPLPGPDGDVWDPWNTSLNGGASYELPGLSFCAIGLGTPYASHFTEHYTVTLELFSPGALVRCDQ